MIEIDAAASVATTPLMVSGEARAAVEKAAAELGFRTNAKMWNGVPKLTVHVPTTQDGFAFITRVAKGEFGRARVGFISEPPGPPR